MTTAKLFPTRSDLAPAVREKSIEVLNQHLADAVDLYGQTKQAHWTVKGAQFYQLHLLFDTLAEAVEEYTDLLAERVAALGGVARGTARVSAARSRLPEYPLDATDGRRHLEALRDRYAAVADTSRAAIDVATSFGDAGTADLFTQLSRGLDQHLWMLEAHLQA